MFIKIEIIVYNNPQLLCAKGFNCKLTDMPQMKGSTYNLGFEGWLHLPRLDPVPIYPPEKRNK